MTNEIKSDLKCLFSIINFQLNYYDESAEAKIGELSNGVSCSKIMYRTLKNHAKSVYAKEFIADLGPKYFGTSTESFINNPYFYSNDCDFMNEVIKILTAIYSHNFIKIK